jgi:hypothetical protein
MDPLLPYIILILTSYMYSRHFCAALMNLLRTSHHDYVYNVHTYIVLQNQTAYNFAIFFILTYFNSKKRIEPWQDPRITCDTKE